MLEQAHREFEIDPEQLELIKVFLSTVEHFWGGFEQLFSLVSDPREQGKIIY